MNVAPFLLKFSTTLVPEYSCSCRSRPETLLTLVEPGQRASPPPDEGGGLGSGVGVVGRRRARVGGRRSARRSARARLRGRVAPAGGSAAAVSIVTVRAT